MRIDKLMIYSGFLLVLIAVLVLGSFLYSGSPQPVLPPPTGQYSAAVADGNNNTYLPVIYRANRTYLPLVAKKFPKPKYDPYSVPYFNQNDPRWGYKKISEWCWCDSVAMCGCELVTVAMVLNYYGIDVDPNDVNECMGPYDCPFVHEYIPDMCTNNKIKFVGYFDFTWEMLEEELIDGPVILRLVKGTHGHLVVVLAGSGNKPENYLIHDPDDRAFMSLKPNYDQGWLPYEIIILRPAD